MTTRRTLGTLAVLALAFSACAAHLSTDPSPQPATVTYVPAGAATAAGAAVPSTEGITQVVAEGFADVEIAAGADPSLSVTCDAEIAKRVHIESQGDRLRIWTDSVLFAVHTGPCVVHAGVPHLRSLELSGSGDGRVRGHAEELGRVATAGSGDVEVEELGAPEASLSTSGSGDITARGLHNKALVIETRGSGDVVAGGTSDRVKIDCSGSGNVDAHGLSAAAVQVHTSGSGDVQVHASEQADVATSGSGDIVVGGRPAQRMASRDGSGTISFE
jgi:Putative auto-transporter adhesin, head GIN domain